jgi:hypothetical protein
VNFHDSFLQAYGVPEKESCYLARSSKATRCSRDNAEPIGIKLARFKLGILKKHRGEGIR